MPSFTRVVVGFAAALGSVLIGGCGSEQAADSGEPIQSQSSSLEEVYENTTLKYIGTCEFLSACAGGDTWCNGSHTCSDTNRWVAKPLSYSTNFCNQRVYLCRQDNPSVCTSALVLETSYANYVWELSDPLIS